MVTKKREINTFKVNTLYHYANEYRKHMTEESEIETINMTERWETKGCLKFYDIYK